MGHIIFWFTKVVLIYRRKHKYIKQKNAEVPLDNFKGAVIE
jgi:hypothetical protein